ncbi:MAG: hypothetical protein AB7G87_05870, partial [Clostridia bacterium]
LHSYGNEVLERQYRYAVKKLNITDEKDKKVVYKILKNSINSMVSPLITHAKSQQETENIDEFFTKIFKK